MSTAIDPNGPVPPECLDDDPWPCRFAWRCPSCGRFIAAAGVREWDVRDDGAYYVRAMTEAECGRCGTVEPQWLPTRWAVSDEA
jgi:ribosomal protein S27E